MWVPIMLGSAPKWATDTDICSDDVFAHTGAMQSIWKKELCLEWVHRKRMNKEFVCPNYFLYSFPIGQNVSPSLLIPSIFGPLVSEKPELVSRDTMLYSSPKWGVIGYGWGAEQETKEVVAGVLRGTWCLCPNTLRILDVRTSHGEPHSRTRRHFSKSLKSQHLENCPFCKTERQASRFSGQEGKQRQGQRNKERVFTNSLCPFKIRKAKCELLSPPT